MSKKKLFRILKIILLVYGLGGILLYYLQDRILFKPVPVARSYDYHFPTPYKEVNIPYDVQVNMSVVQFPTPDSARGVVLYFHGNKDNIAHYASFAPVFTKEGYDLWMIDYPGYGKSTGRFTEKNLYDWALTFYKLARARFSPHQIIIYGKSMGTGIAAQLASVRNCRRLILESPYYSLPSIFASYLPVYPYNQMIHFKIPTHDFLKNVTDPVSIFDGTSDHTIPFRNARRLKPFLKPTDEFIAIPGGHHNDLYRFPLVMHKLDSLLKQ